MKALPYVLVGIAALAFGSPSYGQGAALDPVLHPSSSDSKRSGSNGDWSAMQEEAAAQQAAYDAQKAEADARKAMYEAQKAANELKYGGVAGQTGITGATTFPTEGETPEALLLVHRSADALAKDIYEAISVQLQDEKNRTKSLVILEDGSQLLLADAILFDAKVSELDVALKVAQERFMSAKNLDPGDPTDDEKESSLRSGLPIAGALLNTASQLGSYFLSDYKFASMDSSVDGTAVSYALVHRILNNQNDPNPAGFTGNIVVPGLIPVVDFNNPDSKSVQKQLEVLHRSYVQTLGNQAVAKARQLALAETKKAVAASHYAQADAAATKAIALYDALVQTLSSGPQGADKSEQPFIVRVLRQYEIREALGNSALLLVLEMKTAAQHYSKKNLWTFFGGPPLYTAGSVTMSYALIDHQGDGDRILAIGTKARHGGYRSLRQVEKLYPVENPSSGETR